MRQVRTPGRNHKLRRLCGFLTLAANAWALAAAAGPEAALRYRSPDVLAAEAELRVQQGALEEARLGIGASLEVNPYFAYTEDMSEPIDPPTLGPGVEGIATLGYTYNPPEIMLAGAELLRAQNRLADAKREAVRAALMAYTDLLSAQFEFGRAERDFAEDTQELADTRASYAAGEATATERAMAELGVASAERTLAYAQRSLTDTRADAARYGLKSPATFVPLKFALPQVRAKDTLSYRIAELELERSRALALQNSVYSVVDDIRLGTRYNGDDFEVSGGFGLERGLPSVDVYARYFDRDPEVWTITLDATFRLDDDTVERFDDGARDIEDAQGDLVDLARDLTEQLQDTREEAIYNGGSVDTELRSLTLIARRIAELEALLDTLPARLAALEQDLVSTQARLDERYSERDAETDAARQQTLSDTIATLEGRLAELQTDLGETQQEENDARAGLEQYREFYEISEETLYRSWTEYLTTVDVYLALADESWPGVLK